MMSKNVKMKEGFTLIEFIISISMMSILMLGGVFSMMKINSTSETIKNQVNSATDLKLLSNTLSNYIAMAIDTNWTDVTFTDLNTNKGRIRIFNSGFDLTPQPPEIVGLFLREEGIPSSANNGSDIKATALYFQNPTPDTPGSLRISSSIAGPGSQSLYSNSSYFEFNDIVELSVSPAGHSSVSGDSVRVVRIDLKSRKFIFGSKDNWCTFDAIQTSVGGCENQEINFKDIEKTLFISMVNNRISDETLTATGGSIKSESLYGSLYFFKPVILR